MGGYICYLIFAGIPDKPSRKQIIHKKNNRCDYQQAYINQSSEIDETDMLMNL